MFHKFTEKAIKAIMLAQEEARRMGHNYVGTEMMLLGLINTGSMSADALKNAGLTIASARVETEKIIRRGSGFVAVEIPYSAGAKRALELSWDEAQKLGHHDISAGHLLLGLLREDESESVALQVLSEHGISSEKLRASVLEALENNSVERV